MGSVSIKKALYPNEVSSRI